MTFHSTLTFLQPSPNAPRMRFLRQHQESQPHHMQLPNNVMHFFKLSRRRRCCIAYRGPARQSKNDPIQVSEQSHND
jgi:hypothetical protein